MCLMKAEGKGRQLGVGGGVAQTHRAEGCSRTVGFPPGEVQQRTRLLCDSVASPATSRADREPAAWAGLAHACGGVITR